MKLALKEAEQAFESNEVPVGAVVIRQGQIIGRGHNMVETLKGPDGSCRNDCDYGSL